MREAPRGNFEFSEALGATAGIENRGNGWLQSKPNASTSVLSAPAARVVKFYFSPNRTFINGVTVYRSGFCAEPALSLHISWFILTFAGAKDI